MKRIHSIILSVTCHSLRNFLPLIQSPHIHSWIFEMLWVIISWVWVIRKRLNVNWKKNSLNNFICHLSFLKKLPPTHRHPLISIHEFSKPCKILFLEFESFVKSWMWIGKENSLSNFICHLSFLKKLSPLIHIPSYPFVNFQNPMSYYFMSLSHSSKVKCELEKNSLNNFICHLSFLKKPSPVIYIPSYPFVNFLNLTSYYFLSLSHS